MFQKATPLIFSKSPTENNADTLDSAQSVDVDKMSDGNENEENETRNNKLIEEQK